jgi:hypothetical protein
MKNGSAERRVSLSKHWKNSLPYFLQRPAAGFSQRCLAKTKMQQIMG